MPSNLTEVMTPYIFYRSLNYYLCDLLRFEFVTPQFLGKVSLGEKTYPGLSIDVVEELLAGMQARLYFYYMTTETGKSTKLLTTQKRTKFLATPVPLQSLQLNPEAFPLY